MDIPLAANTYNAARDCSQGSCVVEAIERSTKTLGDKSAQVSARIEALKFLVHFVGDIHQPLHCETDLSKFPPPQGDKGGNLIKVTFFGKSTNFHALWDGAIIEHELSISHTTANGFEPILQSTRSAAQRFSDGFQP